MKRYNLFLAAASAMALIACGSDDEALAPADGPEAINVTTGMPTRAYDDQWEAGDQIGIMEFNSGTVSIENRLYSTTDATASATFTSTNPIYLPTDGTERAYMAYYPYSASLTDNKTYTVDVSDQATQKNIDLMLSDKVAGIKRGNNNVNLVFTHKLVKLALTMAAGDGLTENDMNGMTVKITNQYTQGTLDVTDHTNTVQVTTTGSTPSEITLNIAADGKSAEGIVLPATSLDEVKLTFTMSNTTSFTVPFVWALSDATGLTGGFEAGKKYTFNLKISKTAVTLSGCTITNWTDGGSYTGTAEM